MPNNIFNELSYSTPSPQYLKKDRTSFVNAASSINQAYDINKSQIDNQRMLLENQTGRNENLTKQQQEEYQKAFESFKPYIEAGNYEDADGVASKVALSVASNPVLKHIQEDKAAYENMVKTNQEGIAKGTINPNDFLAVKKLVDSTFNKRIEVDPDTGIVKNKFTGAYIPNDPKLHEQTVELMEKFQKNPTDLPVEVRRQIQGQIDASTAKGQSEGALREAIYKVVLSNPKNREYLEWKADITSKLNRLDETTGELRPYTVADLTTTGIADANGNLLIKTGEDVVDNPKTKGVNEHENAVNAYKQANEQFKKNLFTENGEVNQKFVDNIFKSNLINKQAEDLLGIAGAFDYKITDQKFITDEVWKFNNEKELERYKDALTRKREFDTNASQYYALLGKAPGEKYTISTETGKNILGTETSTATANIKLPENLKLSPNGDNHTVVSSYKKIKDLNETLNEYRQELKNKEVVSTIYNPNIKQYVQIKTEQTSVNKSRRNELMLEIKKIKDEISKLGAEIEKTENLNKSTKSPVFQGKGEEYINDVITKANKYKLPQFDNSDKEKEYYTELKKYVDLENKLKQLGNAPVKVGNAVGGANARVNEKGQNVIDVEYELEGSSKGIRNLSEKEIESLIDKGILIEKEAAIIKDGKVTKPGKYIYKAEQIIEPTVQDAIRYETETKGKTTIDRIESDALQYQYKKELDNLSATGNKSILNSPLQSGSETTVLEVIQALRNGQVTDLAQRENLMEQVRRKFTK